METIKTATGNAYPCDYLSVIPYPAQAYIRILNTPLATVATVFGDPAETAALEYGEYNLTGYTHLVAIIPEVDAVKVCLGKE